MAVYTKLSENDLKEFFSRYNIGKIQKYEEIKEGIVVAFAIFEGKVGVAVGVTNQLTEKFNAVTLVKIASEILGGKGGGGRKDFAQAGGSNKDKIEKAIESLSKKIN